MNGVDDKSEEIKKINSLIDETDEKKIHLLDLSNREINGNVYFGNYKMHELLKNENHLLVIILHNTTANNIEMFTKNSNDQMCNIYDERMIQQKCTMSSLSETCPTCETCDVCETCDECNTDMYLAIIGIMGCVILTLLIILIVIKVQ